MRNQYIEKLKRCIVPEEVRELFKNAKLGNRNGSHFFDNKISVIDSGYLSSDMNIKLDGIVELAFRTILFLKFEGHLGNRPINTGEVNYFTVLHSTLLALSELKDISSMEDIDADLLDTFIGEELLEKGLKATTVRTKVSILLEYLSYPEIEIPDFLLPNQNIVYSLKYPELVEKCKIEVSSRGLVASAKKTYPLSNLKTLMSHAIEYMDKYSKDILYVLKHIMEVKGLSQEQTYSKSFDFFKNSDWEFTEPSLMLLQKKARGAKTKYSNKNKKNLGRSIAGNTLRQSMIDALDTLEAACIGISLMMTGMRVGELATLDRDLNISQDEHYNLERMVYKTAADESGEPLIMPIPSVCKKALEILSEISTIKDGQPRGSLLLTSVKQKKIKSSRTSRINILLNRYCDMLGIERITPHQFRHAMAFLIVHIHENDGLELARMFLGHTSITMTLQYMGHYNKELREAMEELSEEESATLASAISEEIRGNRKLFGEGGKRLASDHSFTGQQAEDFAKLLRKGLLTLIEEKKLTIIQTPVGVCLHDTSKPENLSCQRGFDIKEIAKGGAAPARCTGAACSNSVFFESHIEDLKEDLYQNIDPALKERLEENTFFIEAGGFEQDPFKRLIREYDEHKNNSGAA